MIDPLHRIRVLFRSFPSLSAWIGVSVVVVVLAACGGGDNPLDETTGPTQTAETRGSSAPTTTTGRQESTESAEAEEEAPARQGEDAQGELEADVEGSGIESRFVRLEVASDGSITITGRGAAVTESFELGQATWEFTAQATNNIDTFTEQAEFAIFDLIGDGDQYYALLGGEEVESGEWSETVEVEPGHVYVDALVADGADWTVKLTPVEGSDMGSRFLQFEVASDGSITITGRGAAVTESFELGDATWEFTARVTNNIDTFTEQAAFVVVELAGDDFDDDNYFRMLGVEEVESGEWGEVIDVGFDLFEVEPGYFYVDTRVADGAEWTVKLTPDQVPPTTTVPAEPRETLTFTGTGPTITDQVEVTAGWWRYEFTIEGNTETINGVEEPAYVYVAADQPSAIYLIFDEEADAGTWTQTDNVGGAEPGIWSFEIAVTPDATWSLTMTPLER